MISYYYKVDISPGASSGEEEATDKKAEITGVKTCIYLSFNSTNKMYENKALREVCKLYTLSEVPNRQAIMPLDYKKLGKVSSSPLVKINVFLDSSVTDSTSTDTAAPDITLDKGTFPLLPETPSSAASSSSSLVKIKRKKCLIMACRTGTDLFTICKNILNLKNLKLGSEGWTIKRVTAIDRLLVDVRD